VIGKNSIPHRTKLAIYISAYFEIWTEPCAIVIENILQFSPIITYGWISL
jgi:hypothetical protein